MTMLKRLVTALEGDGWRAYEEQDGTHRFVRSAADRLATLSVSDPSVAAELAAQEFTLRATTQDVDDYLAALADSGQQVYGHSLPTVDANFQLLLVHLDEQVATHSSGSTVRIADSTITATEPPPRPTHAGREHL